MSDGWTYLPELPPWPADPGDSLALLVTHVDYKGRLVVSEADVYFTHDDYWGATPEQIGKWYIKTPWDDEFHYPDYKGLVAWMLMPEPAEPAEPRP